MCFVVYRMAGTEEQETRMRNGKLNVADKTLYFRRARTPSLPHLLAYSRVAIHVGNIQTYDRECDLYDLRSADSENL